MLAKLKGWRTVIVNALTAIPAAALALLDALKADVVDLQTLLPPGRSAKIIAGMAIANIVLRVLTTGPVGSKE